MKIVAALLQTVPLDPRGRRAVDEVLADWRYESSLAGSRLRRATLGTRAIGALVVTLALVTLRDVRVAVRHDLLIMTCAWLVVFTGRNLSSMGPPTLPSALLRSDYNVLWALSQLNSTLARGLSGAALVILAGAFWGTRIWVRVLVAALVLATVWSVGFTSWHPALFSYERLIRAWLIPAGAMLVAAAVALRKKGRATITAECW
jgi:hypothetical protein